MEHLPPQLETPLRNLDEDDATVDEVANVHVLADDKIFFLPLQHHLLQSGLMVNEDSISVDPDQVVAFLQLAADTRVSPQQRQRTLSLLDCDVDIQSC